MGANTVDSLRLEFGMDKALGSFHLDTCTKEGSSEENHMEREPSLVPMVDSTKEYSMMEGILM